MSKRKLNWAILVLFVLVGFIALLSQREKTANRRQTVPTAAKEETKSRKIDTKNESRQIENSPSAGFVDDEITTTLTDVSLGKIGEKSVELTRDVYRHFTELDFSEASSSELVFVRDERPGSAGLGYYISILRNYQGEIIARAVLTITMNHGGAVDLEPGNIEPFPPAFTNPDVQASYRNRDKYPLKEPFPLITEDKARMIVQEKFSTTFISNGLTSLYVYLPSDEEYYQIGTWFTPYYEFSQLGNESEKLWINCETGAIINQTYLDSEVDQYETKFSK